MVKPLKTLNYPCPCGDRILNAGGLASDVWVRCPACDRPHLPPSNIDEIPRARRRSRSRPEHSDNALNGASVTTQLSVSFPDHPPNHPNHDTLMAGEGVASETGEASSSTMMTPESVASSSGADAFQARASHYRDARSRVEPAYDSELELDEELLDPIVAFERRRARDQRIRRSESALLRRVFGLSLFMIVCAWTTWNCVYHWDEVGGYKLAVFIVAMILSLGIAFSDMISRHRDD